MLGIMPPQASPQPQRPPAHVCRKSTSVQPTFYRPTLSLCGADNPSSRYQLA
jgi:hypothetical protein